MKDLHTHILPGIDDGSRNINESREIIKSLYKNGVTDLVLTPHYITDEYTSSYDNNLNLVKDLQNNKVNLYLANEIYLDNNIFNYLESNLIKPLFNKYLLIELPLVFNEELNDIIDELLYRNYKLIIVHPERYDYVINDIHFLDKYLNKGILLQGNYTTLFNKYGKDSKKTLIKLIKNNSISFLSSDIHKNNIDISESKLRRKLFFITNKNNINNMLINNFDKLMNNEI